MKPLYIYKVELLKVVDGDTFDFKIDLGFSTFITDRVRLYSVDTPEVYGAGAEPRGKDASEFARSWLGIATELFLHSTRYDHREKYGRILGEVYRDSDPLPLGFALREAGHSK